MSDRELISHTPLVRHESTSPRCDLLVYADGGVEIRVDGLDPIVLAYPPSPPEPFDSPGLAHPFEYREFEFSSWYDRWFWTGLQDGPSLCHEGFR